MRPSVAVARSSKDSLISTIGTSYPQAKRGRKIEEFGHFRPASPVSQAGLRIASCRARPVLPALGAVVQKGFDS